MNSFDYPTQPRIMERMMEQIEYAMKPYHSWSDGPTRPTREQWEDLLSCAFAASLESEESRSVVFTLTFFGEQDRSFPYTMKVPFSPRNLARLSVALDLYRSRICVVPTDTGLVIRGLVHLGNQHAFDGKRQLLHKFSIRVLGPGILLVSCGDKPLLTYRRGQLRYWGGVPSHLLNNLLRSALSFHFRLRTTENEVTSDLLFTRAIETIARAILSHRHGGTLLILPKGARWEDRVLANQYAPTAPVTPIQEAFAKREGYERIRNEESKGNGKDAALPDVTSIPTAAQLSSELEWLGQLTATDGMTVIHPDLTLLGFGVFFKTQDSAEDPTLVSVTDLSDDRGDSQQSKALDSIGGARHQSAAVTCRHFPGAVAVVASQDGTLTSMICEPSNKVVTAFRHLELLLDL